MEPTLTYLQDLARKASEFLLDGYNIRPGYGEARQVSYKGAIDVVTEVDAKSEAYLIEEIRKNFPDHRIIAEESGETAGGDCCAWYLDPLDGTVNFVHGLPLFSISIGYVVNGEPKLGVVYDPVRDECFSAEKGAGAWLNGEPIRTSRQPGLDRALLVTGFPYDIRTHPVNNFDLFQDFSLKAQAVRRLGSAALDLCYVAAGRLDGYWELLVEPWDIAAGIVIAREAGATVTRLDNNPELLSPPTSILAANSALHAVMGEVIREAGHPKR
jgi:myo-inositol-1(or 4)-monophosphatase